MLIRVRTKSVMEVNVDDGDEGSKEVDDGNELSLYDNNRPSTDVRV